MSDRTSELWAVVLAGGDGTRLAALTRALYGTALPKQFAVLSGSRSMLQATVDRILPVVPPERIVVVISRKHELTARQQLREWSPQVTILVQPANLDTGAGLLLPLAWLHARDASGYVAVFPSDHHVQQPEVLRAAIELAASDCQVDPARVSLLGAQPDGPDADYGWIVPGRRLERDDRYAVLRFHEKPEPVLAGALLRQGALWNTFIMVATIDTLRDLGRRYLPDHATRLEACASPQDLDAAYAVLPPANFSRAVLERAGNLALVPLRGAGWSDWGTPGRVFRSLAGTPDHDRLIQRLAQADAQAVA
jgi:mannose-1-phosphate guanylyltransferase